MTVARVLVAVFGGLVIVGTFISAVRTVVLPRAAVSPLTRVHFLWLRWCFDRVARPSSSWERRDAVMAMYAPVALVLLPAVWLTFLAIGLTAVLWGTGLDPLIVAAETSGSSLLTLGFLRPDGAGRVLVTFAGAALGLLLLSLMISYLPSIYGAFRTRETLVGMLEGRAGLPSSPAEMLVRYHRIGMLDGIDDDLFRPWEHWFVDVEESHTTQPSLVFFRSTHPERSWLTAAGCVLDTAAIVQSAIDRPRTARPALMLRTGFMCLRRVADFYGIEYDPDPAPTDPISVTRDEFEAVCTDLRDQGVPIVANLDQAWRDFQGWRVNYDTVLLALCALVMAPPAMWSSDRSPARRPRPPLRRRKSVSPANATT